MADLIDRQAAIDEAYAVIVDDAVYDVVQVETLEGLPSVDAVEVVRCKDCKHRYVDGENVRYNVCELNHNKVQSDDWYCADGEQNDVRRI